MTDETLRIAILGAGAMGAEHAAVLAGIKDVEVVGVFARDIEHARKVAAICGGEACDDAMALISAPAVDAVDICLPSSVHPAFAIPALAGGKHVFCETPMALELDAAREMREAARSAGRLLQVGLLMRSVSPYAHVKEAAERGEHGRLVSLTTWRLGSYLRAGAPDHKAHYSDPSTELMTFDFDFAGWLMGRPARLCATAAAERGGGVPGEISALLAWDDGGSATILASGVMPRGFAFTVGFRALFEGAAFELSTVFAEFPPTSRFTITTDGAGPRDVATPDRNPYEVELRRFVDCVRGRAGADLLDAERAIEALTLSIATQRSLAQSRWIEIETL